MFINLSNHPSTKWETEQIRAAAAYGKIEDIPFPDISPDWDTTTVESLVKDYYSLCQQLLSDKKHSSAVHLAGEPVFCFILAQLLLKENYICLISTTERKVTTKDNLKTSNFKFVRFRNYQLIK